MRSAAYVMRSKVESKLDQFKNDLESRIKTLDMVDFSKLRAHDFKSTPDWVRRSIRLVGMMHDCSVRLS